MTKGIDISQFVGIPFVDGGRDMSGCDCWGLAMLVFKAYGADIPDYQISCHLSDKINDKIAVESTTTWMEIKEPVEPCLVVLAMDARLPTFCNHLGVYVGNGKFIHAILKQHAVVSRLSDVVYKDKIKGFYVYK